MFPFGRSVQCYHFPLSWKMASSTTTLSKPNFETFTKGTFRNLLNDEDFTDVTLACDDGQLVKAHKVILAAASPFFKRILGQAAHPNPLIHIQGIKAFHLKLMLHFIYLGGATIETGDVEEFFETTRSLRIEGLEEVMEQERNQSMHEDEELQPTDLYEDMRRLNSLYEELCWDHQDILEFYPDYDNNCNYNAWILGSLMKKTSCSGKEIHIFQEL